MSATVGLVVIAGVVVWLLCRDVQVPDEEIVVEEEPVELLYGIPKDQYNISEGEFVSGETIGALLGKYGVGAAKSIRLPVPQNLSSVCATCELDIPM